MNKTEFLKKDRQFGMSEKYNKEFESDLNDVIKDEMFNFVCWYDNLSVADKRTVHPPAGSGGCYGIYPLSARQIIQSYLNRKP